ncbi:class I SAM-dependent methyltransferase [Propionivibrio sp.]|uniref:class I SAM-dependent methyltransferase n=1 Tax=Propionivibrio sp. TaxID=2212460 RepID=UPI0026259C88|nr:class I SAM-dependent methyltransferase [Propionivibrio sp.]
MAWLDSGSERLQVGFKEIKNFRDQEKVNKFLAMTNRAIRELGLLNASENIRYFAKVIRCYWPNRQFKSAHPEFKTPPRELAFDAYSAPDWDFYKTSGEGTAAFLATLIKQYQSSSPDGLKVLEWGCGPARVIRHLPGVLGAGTDVSGSDYNEKSITWCSRNIPGVTFLTNELNPPLKLSGNCFDVCYSISVFTHLSNDVCRAWVKEIYRVLKHGGIFITTTNGESKLEDLFPDEIEKYRSEGVVVRGNFEEGKKMYFACHSPKYLAENLFKCFEVLEHRSANFPFTAQDMWVLRK